MAVKRNYPNDYFCWYNDDDRIAILERVTSTDSTETHSEPWDTFQSDGDLSGNITATSSSAGAFVDMTSASHGLAVNDRVTISGTTTYDGNYAITKTDANVFTFSHSGSTSNETGSFTSLFIDNGLRITYKSKYETVTAISQDLDTDIGLDTSLHPTLVCYMKARLYEDQGNMEQANYFRQMYETQLMKQKSRKSGVRGLSVPNL